MGLFTRVVRSPFLVRKLLVELRGIRRALERAADVQELLAGTAPRPGAQSFRGFSRERQPGNGEGSGVAYADRAFLAQGDAKRQDLWPLLGREPTDEELERAVAGDIE